MFFHNPAALFALAAIPIIIIMYLLKQKHKTMVIPSLFLWEKAQAAAQSHRPWQKLRKSILLFLQLLIALLVALALAAPYIKGEGEAGDIIAVIDCSMSMQTLEGSSSRFDMAKAQVRTLISNMDSKATIVVLDKKPHVLYSGTDKNEALRRLNEVNASDRSVDFAACLNIVRMAYNESAIVYLFSDRDYDFDNMQVLKNIVGTETENMAITLVSHSIDAHRIVGLVKVKNFGLEKVSNSLSVYVDDVIWDTEDVILEPSEEKSFIFTDLPVTAEVITAKLMFSDNLLADDSYYHAIVKDSVKRTVLVTERNVFLENILNILPNVDLYKSTETSGLSGYYLYVFDGVLPETLPNDGHMLIINPPVGNSLLETEDKVEVTGSWIADKTWFNFLQDVEFYVTSSKKIKVPTWATEIMSSNETPLIIAGEKENQKIMVLAFDLYNTDLPLKKDFPIFMYNISKWFIQSGIVQTDKIFSGEILKLSPNPDAKTVSIVYPNKTMQQVAPPFPAETWEAGGRGLYLVEQTTDNGKLYERFGVNVETEKESYIASPSIEQGEINITTSDATKELRNIILVIVLALLALEWWVYKRGL